MAESARINYEEAGPKLLSEQPNEIKPKVVTKKQAEEWQALRGHLEGRLSSLRNWRNTWWFNNWSSLAEYILPRRSIWLTQNTGGQPSPNNMTRGLPINQAILDPTGTYAARVCSAGLMSGLASPSRPWFKLKSSLKGIDIPSEGRVWMDEVEERMYLVLAGSNFYNSFAQECEDNVIFGTAPSIIYEDVEDIIRLYNPTCGEYFCASSSTNRINGLYRYFVMTIAQIVDFFGLENCPEEVRSSWKQKSTQLDREMTVAHAIEPNFDIEGAPKLPGDFTWRETYWIWATATDRPLSQAGFKQQPFTVARWSTQSNDAYGRSVGMEVLPDIIQLQVETARKAEGIEKGLRPPLIADMSMKNQPSSILPGHVTYVPNLNSNTGMRSIYEVNFDLQWVSADIREIQTRVKAGFFNDLFLMLNESPTNGRMTAYEVAQKLQEKLQVLGPVIESLITESLKPKLKRIYSIMQKRKLLPPMPDSMKGIALDVEFISMLALAQKATATGGLERLAALVGNMVAVFPEAKDVLNVDQFINEMNSLLANPEKILNGPEKIKQIRDAQQQAMQKQQQMQDQEHAVNTANTGAQAAQTLASTQIGGGQSALQTMLGGGMQAVH